MKLKYTIEFTEEVEDTTEEELAMVKRRMEKHLKKYISYSGVITQDFKLTLDLDKEWGIN